MGWLCAAKASSELSGLIAVCPSARAPYYHQAQFDDSYDSGMISLRSVAWISIGFVVGVAGQATTNVTCSASTSWMVNALGQNPCLVSAYLSSTCNNGQWFVPTLIAQGPYNPPSGTGVTTCRCNTVAYSVIEACSVCQGGLVGTWSDWISFCPANIVAKSYPNTIPSGTVIPGWAYLDPTITNSWNATAANAYAVASPSSTPNISTFGPTSSSSSSPTPSAAAAKKSSNTGPIVGGVVGGVAVLAILGLIIWYCLRRSSRGKGQRVVPAPYQDPGLNEPGYNNGGYTPVVTPGLPMKQYDPSDPSTFPDSPAPTSTHPMVGLSHVAMSDGGYPSHGGMSPPPQSHRATPGAYTGAAEV